MRAEEALALAPQRAVLDKVEAALGLLGRHTGLHAGFEPTLVAVQHVREDRIIDLRLVLETRRRRVAAVVRRSRRRPRPAPRRGELQPLHSLPDLVGGVLL